MLMARLLGAGVHVRAAHKRAPAVLVSRRPPCGEPGRDGADAGAEGVPVISRADFIQAAMARALQWVEDHAPADGPMLGEAEDMGLCRLGHPLKMQGDRQRCLVCANERQRARRRNDGAA